MDDGIHTYEKLNESTNNILDHVLDRVPCLKLHQHSKAVRSKNKHRHAQTELTRSLKFAEWSFTLGRHETHQPTHQPTNWQPTNIPTHQQQTTRPFTKPTHQESNNLATDQTTNRQTNQPTNQPTANQPANQQTNRPTNKPTSNQLSTKRLND